MVILEGAGGLLVPLAEGQRYADLTLPLGSPLLVVARSALGTINHTSPNPRCGVLQGAFPSLAWLSTRRRLRMRSSSIIAPSFARSGRGCPSWGQQVE